MSTKPESIKSLALKVLRDSGSTKADCPTKVAGVGQPVGQLQVCWHCHGSKACRCIVCGAYAHALQWVAGDCICCKGQGAVRVRVQ
jgi:hypothetical protein